MKTAYQLNSCTKEFLLPDLLDRALEFHGRRVIGYHQAYRCELTFRGRKTLQIWPMLIRISWYVHVSKYKH